MAWIHVRGVGPGRIVGNVLAALKVSALLMFIALGFSIGSRLDAPISIAVGTGRRRRLAAGAHSGDVHVFGLERGGVRRRGDPRSGPQRAARARDRHARGDRHLRRCSTRCICTCCRSTSSPRVQRQRARCRSPTGCSGARAGNVMGVVSIISLAASISAMTFAGPRVYYAMARDGVFFRSRGARASALSARRRWRSSRRRSGAACSCSRAAPTRSTTYTGFAVVLFAGVAWQALFVLRRREPDAPRPFRAWGYPVGAGHLRRSPARDRRQRNLFGSGCAPAERASWGPAAAGIIIIALGVPLYFFFTRRAL